MVKRKADISLDEWLVRGVRSDEPTITPAIAASDERPSDSSIEEAEVVTGPTTAQPATSELVTETLRLRGDRLQAARKEGDVHEWFWLLLEQCGYECW